MEWRDLPDDELELALLLAGVAGRPGLYAVQNRQAPPVANVIDGWLHD